MSDKEAKLYLSILECGEAPVSVVARRANLNRSTAYSLLAALEHRGCISLQRKKGIQYVSACSPHVLIDTFEQSVQMAKSALPQLVALAYASPSKPRLQFFDGLEGIKQVCRECLQAKKDLSIFVDYARMPPDLRQFLWSDIIPSRKKRQNFARIIAPLNQINEEEKTRDDTHFAKHCLIPFPEHHTIPLEVVLWGDRYSAFLSFSAGEHFAIILDSKAIHETMMSLFLLLWESNEMKDN